MRLRVFICSKRLLFLCVFCLALGSNTVAGQDEDAFRPADTSSPRATMQSFLDSCNEIYKRTREDKHLDRTSLLHRPLALRILDCLDTSELPGFAREQRAGEVAICLKEILDRVKILSLNDIPDAAAIEAAEESKKPTRYQIPGTRISIVRIEDGPQRHEYLFSKGTVDRAVEYFEDVKHLPYREGPDVTKGFYKWYISAPGKPWIAAIVNQLPEWAKEKTFGLAFWKWPALLLTLLLCLVLMVMAYRIQRRLAKQWRGTRVFFYCLTILLPIGAMLIPLLFKHVAEDHLTLRGDPLYITTFSADLVVILASLVVVFAASNRIAESIIASPRINPQGLDAQLIRIVTKLTSLVVTLIIFLVGGQYLGMSLTTLLASAGVGGFAIAMAAQDTLKTLFGTIMLMADKPFRVGERIILGRFDGVVEDIGLRSTKLRLLSGHLATIPNDELARIDIENVGRRPFIRRVADIHIPLDTPREKIENAVAIIRGALENHEGMPADYPPRVYFKEFNEDSFGIRVIYWYDPPNYWDFLAFSEKFNFDIFRAFEEQGIRFSLPSRMTYTSTGGEQRPVELRMVDEKGPTASATS